MKPPERRKSTVGWAVWRERERERDGRTENANRIATCK